MRRYWRLTILTLCVSGCATVGSFWTPDGLPSGERVVPAPVHWTRADQWTLEAATARLIAATPLTATDRTILLRAVEDLGVTRERLREARAGLAAGGR